MAPIDILAKSSHRPPQPSIQHLNSNSSTSEALERLFNELQPLCLSLMNYKKWCGRSSQLLPQLLKTIHDCTDANALTTLAPFILTPIYRLLHDGNHQCLSVHLEHALEVLGLILSKCGSKCPFTVLQSCYHHLLSFHCTFYTDTKERAKSFEDGQHLTLNFVICLGRVFECVDAFSFVNLLPDPHRSSLASAQCISMLLEFASHKSSALTVKMESLQSLQLLLQLLKPEEVRKFFPGICSTLARMVSEGNKERVCSKTLELLQLSILRAFLRTNADHAIDASTPSTSSNAHLLSVFQLLKPLIHHQAWRVRLAVCQLSSSVILGCYRVFGGVLVPLVDVLVVGGFDECEKVNSTFRAFSATIQSCDGDAAPIDASDFTTLSPATTRPSSIGELISNRLIWLLQHFGAELSCAALDRKLRHLQLCVGYIRLLLDLGSVEVSSLIVLHVDAIVDGLIGLVAGAGGKVLMEEVCDQGMAVVGGAERHKDFFYSENVWTGENLSFSSLPAASQNFPMTKLIHYAAALCCLIASLDGGRVAVVDRCLEVARSSPKSVARHPYLLICWTLPSGSSGSTANDTDLNLMHGGGEKCFEMILSEFLDLAATESAPAFSLALSEANSFTPDTSTSQENSIVGICGLLNCLAVVVPHISQDFLASQLVDLIYPLLELLGAPTPLLRQTSRRTLAVLARCCRVDGDGGVSQIKLETKVELDAQIGADTQMVKAFLAKHVDYVSENIARRLRHFLDFRSAPRVLSAVVAVVGADVIPMIQDSVELIFDIIGQHQFSAELVACLLSPLHSLLAILSPSDSARSDTRALIEDSTPFNSNLGPNQPPAPFPFPPTSCSSSFQQLTLKLQQCCFSIAGKLHDQRVAEQHRRHLLDSSHRPPSPDLPIPTATSSPLPDSPSYKLNSGAHNAPELVVRILTILRHFIDSFDPRTRLDCLKSFGRGFMLLAPQSPLLIHHIHVIWPSFLLRLVDSNVAVVIEAIQLSATMATACGDFMMQRMRDDLIPHFKRIRLHRSCHNAAVLTKPHYRHSFDFKIQQKLMSATRAFCASSCLTDAMAVDLSLDHLHYLEYPKLFTEAVLLFEELLKHHRDAVLFILLTKVLVRVGDERLTTLHIPTTLHSSATMAEKSLTSTILTNTTPALISYDINAVGRTVCHLLELTQLLP